MILINRFQKSFIVLLLAVITLTAENQNPESKNCRSVDILFENAMLLFEKGYYYNCITEFKRLKFFDEEKKYSYSADFHIGLAYKNGGYFFSAAESFSEALGVAETMPEKITAIEYLARCYMLNGEFLRAERILIKLEEIFPEQSKNVRYWKGWNLILQDRFLEAANYFNDTCPELEKFCINTEEKKYSLSFAEYISYILPGSGEIYAGKLISGLISLSWNVFFGYISVNAFNTGRVFDGILNAGFWQRFYFGSSSAGKNAAKEENKLIRYDAYEFLIKEFKGRKP